MKNEISDIHGALRISSSDSSPDTLNKFNTMKYEITEIHRALNLPESESPTEVIKTIKRLKNEMNQMRTEPDIQVGILSAPSIEFTLSTPYRLQGQMLEGPQKAVYANGRILLNGQSYNDLFFEPAIPARSGSPTTPNSPSRPSIPRLSKLSRT